MANTVWSGFTGGKLFVQSGSFTSTIKTSEDVSAVDAQPGGITCDLTNTPWLGQGDGKLYLTSGQFTSTVKTSEFIGGAEPSPSGISWDGTNSPWTGFNTDVLYLQSGQFSSTTKTSTNVQAIEAAVSGISWDGTNTPFCGFTDDKLYLSSGQFTTTIKDSEDVSAVDAQPFGIGWDGTNTSWSGNEADKLYLTSGQFTSTLKDSESVTAIDTAPSGAETTDYNARIGLDPSTTADGAFDLPLMWQNNPNIIQFPVISVQGGSGATGVITLPLMTVDSTGTPADSIGVVSLPLFTVDAVGSGPGAFIDFPVLVLNGIAKANEASITLPAITISAKADMPRAVGEITLPRFTFYTVGQQGQVENLDLTLPMITLNAYSGHPMGLTLPQFTLAAEGSNGYVGTFSKSLPRMTVNVKADQENLATFTNPLPQFSLVFSGLQGIVSTSVGNRTLPIFNINAHAYRGENGSASITLLVPILTTVTTVDPDGAFSSSLLMLTLDAYADVYTNRII